MRGVYAPYDTRQFTQAADRRFMLTLTQKTHYAIVALAHLLRDKERVCSAREIAGQNDMPVPILMNILKTLSREGMVTSVRGAHGGYRLAQGPDDISLHMVIRAFEGPVNLFPCSGNNRHDDSLPGCERTDCCPISTPARAVSSRLREFLDSVTLTEIACNLMEDCAVTCAQSVPSPTSAEHQGVEPQCR